MAEVFFKFLDLKVTIFILFMYMDILAISARGDEIETFNLCIPKEESVLFTHCKLKEIFKSSHLVNPDEIPALKKKFENNKHSYRITKSEVYLLKDEFLKKRKHRNASVIEIKQVDDFNRICKISWLQTCNQNNLILAKACIASSGSTIKRCENIPYSKNPLSVCIQGPQKEVVTCHTFQTLCFVSEYDHLHLHPCRKPHLQACIGTGVLDICPNTVTPIEVAMENQSNNMRQTRYRSLKNHHLCKSKSTGKFYKCSMNSTDFICLLNEKSSLGYCQMFTNIFKDRRQVCVEDSTDILLICENHNQKRICISETKNATYNICNSNSQVACLYAEKIQNCYPTSLLNQTKELENTRKIRKQSKHLYKNSPRFLVSDTILDNHIFGRRIRRNSHSKKDANDEGFNDNSYSAWLKNKSKFKQLCMNESDQNTFKICKNEAEVNTTCLGFIEKRIKPCEDNSTFDFNSPIVDFTFPICVKGEKKEVFICGEVFQVHVCDSEDSKSEKFGICFDKKRYLCLDGEGQIKNCGNKNDDDDSKKNVKHHLSESSNDDNEENDNSEQYKSYAPDKTEKGEEEYESYGPYVYLLDTKTHQIKKKKKNEERRKEESQEQSNSDKNEGTRSDTQSMSPNAFGSVDEKFYQLHCDNCSIESILTVDGESKEILPDAEVIIFDES